MTPSELRANRARGAKLLKNLRVLPAGLGSVVLSHDVRIDLLPQGMKTQVKYELNRIGFVGDAW